MDVTPWYGRWWQLAIGIVLLGVLWFSGAIRPRNGSLSEGAVPPLPNPASLDLGRPTGLPLPSRLSIPEFERKLFAFLNDRTYAKLGWRRDKSVRDTGPYQNGRYHGTHPAVRVYYSPGVMRWLLNGRKGAIPDGEMIVKEQFAPPAIRHRATLEGDLPYALESWTVMVKDAAGSHDGWFWSNPSKGQQVGDHQRDPFADPISGFGLACIRCHAATQSPGAEPSHPANEFTFASLRNIEGFPGTPLTFRTDDSWRQGSPPAPEVQIAAAVNVAAAAAKPAPDAPTRIQRVSHRRLVSTSTSTSTPAAAPFPDLFAMLKPVEPARVSPLPAASLDWVVSRRDQNQEFLTSNQCMSCHAGLLAPFGPTMFVPTTADVEYGAKGWDVSPYGEWRWTPMGLAGRDPFVFAQIESEIKALCKQHESQPAVAARLCATLADTCMRCHGAMGKRQYALDHQRNGPAAAMFSVDHVHEVADPASHPGQGDSKYGALARDGVSCVLCHRMQPPAQPPSDHRPYLQFLLETTSTGNFQLGRKGEIYGPFRNDEIASYAMEHATGLKPKQSPFLKSSQLCASCHTVVLPNVDRPLDPAHADELTASEVVPEFRKFHHHVEQATYLEWLNSEYENEINTKNPRARSCQDCHMASGLKDEANGLDLEQLATKIAVIQDDSYPEAENLAPGGGLHIRRRESGYRRHNFSGLNAFLLEMFNQFDRVLGVPKTDYMTGSKQGLEHAVGVMTRTARNDVATLSVAADSQGSNRLKARVVVASRVGHRFPSGVGFRRAFLELAVVEAGPGGTERVVWASGLTNEQGVILGADGKPLPSEFFNRDPSGRQQFQPHHEVISSPDQVQVYETLLRDAQGNFTTSFVRSCETVKDNRLLPRGWRAEGPGPGLTGRFLKATHPGPLAADDPRYQDGSGTDEVTYRIELPEPIDPARLQVRATLYYQAVPPYFLRNLFATAPDGPATQRLHHLCSQLNLKGTAIEDWKLPITSAVSPVAPAP